MSIFVSIASYCDDELENTVFDMFASADRPQDIYVGIYDQTDTPSDALSNLSNVRYLYVNKDQAKGTGIARKIASSLYIDEDYYFQIDSHMRFDAGWDTFLINELEDIRKSHGKAIISHSPLQYFIKDGLVEKVKHDGSAYLIPFNDDQCAWMARSIVFMDGSPKESQMIMAAFLFTTADYLLEIPHDQNILYRGEEICTSIRAYTRGWKIFAPSRWVAWHYFFRDDAPKVWQNDDGVVHQWWKDSMNKEFDYVRSILCGEDLDIYGIGDVELYQEYQSKIGISFQGYYDVIVPMKLGVAPNN